MPSAGDTELATVGSQVTEIHHVKYHLCVYQAQPLDDKLKLRDTTKWLLIGALTTCQPAGPDEVV